MSVPSGFRRDFIPVPPPVQDPATGRSVYTLVAGGAETEYFRRTCTLPDGRIIAYGKYEGDSAIYLLAPGEPTVEVIRQDFLRRGVRVRASDGLVMGQSGRQVVGLDLIAGTCQVLGELPADQPGALDDVSIDGHVVFLNYMDNSLHDLQPPTSMDPMDLWRWIDRPRRGSLYAHDLRTATSTLIYEGADHLANHVDACPGDPGLVRFCTDRCEAKFQRTYTVRTDGSDLRAIRPQAVGEVVTHEFWWADPAYVGYTYQDRRGDDTLEALPWCEYSPIPTQLGLANLAGDEVYLSDPLDSYHQHLISSPDGSLLMGDGNVGNCFVAVSPFDMAETKIAFTKLASISSPFPPFRGQRVNAHITPDNRWVVYNEEFDGHMHIRAVAIDF